LQEAERLLEEALGQYPKASVFYAFASHLAQKQNRIQQAQGLLETAISLPGPLPEPPLLYRYELANVLCIQGAWAQAADIYAALVAKNGFQVRGLAAMQYAGCLVMLGRQEEALVQLQQLSNMTLPRSRFDPAFLQRQAKRYLANGGLWLPLELLYFRRDLVKMLPMKAQLYKTLQETATSLNVLEKELPSEPKAKGSNFVAKVFHRLAKKSSTNYNAEHRAA
jgi:tetratricopeptide (TPR) repeat protein